MSEISERKKWINESKLRCKRMGLNPNKSRITRSLTRTELIHRQTINEPLIKSALPYMQLCSETFKICGSILVLTDKEGYILKAIGPESILQSRIKIGLGEGGSLREEDAGTNAVALAIRHKRPVYVEGKEYFLKIFQSGACFCAPIILNGELSGTIVIVYPQKKGHPHTFSLVRMLARLIEEIYEKIKEKDFLSALLNSFNAIAINTDQKGIIKWLTHRAKKILNVKKSKSILEIFDDSILNYEEITNGFVESRSLKKNFLMMRRIYNDGFLFILKPASSNSPGTSSLRNYTAPYTFDDIVGLEEIKEQVQRIAIQDVNLLIIGESGTGKELLASAIHNASLRAKERFVVVNCAAVPENLFESELFGYKRGAFTDARYDKIGKIEYANNGTLFFDEIAELPPNVQAKLLRVLEDKKVVPLGSNEGRIVNVRFIFATNRNLEELVSSGKFRGDLYYRIHSPKIELPPLRERRNEIPILIEHLLLKIKEKYKGFVSGLTEQAKKYLMDFDYPGNVRQLEKMLEQAFLTCKKEYIDVENLRFESIEPLSLEQKVQRYKAKLIYNLFITNGRNIKKTCAELGLSERQIYRYLKMIKVDNQK